MCTVGGKSIAEWTITDLKEELKKRGLSTDGVKVVLAVRLNRALREEEEQQETVKKGRHLAPIIKRNNKENIMSTVASAAITSPNSETQPENQENLVENVKVGSEQEAEIEDVKDESLDLEIDEEQEAEDDEDGMKTAVESQSGDAATSAAKDDVKEPTPEGEDEFEEDEEPAQEEKVEEKPEDVSAESHEKKEPEPVEIESKPEEPKESEKEQKVEDEDDDVIKIPQNQDEEIFLDYEEDLLDDPLDEEPTNSEDNEGDEKKEKDVANSSTSSDASTDKNASKTSSTSASAPASGGSHPILAEDAKKLSIWIRGMSPTTKAASVKQLTSQYGKVIQSKIFNSRPINGEIKNCFALVTFAEEKAMETAISFLHQKNYQGRVLRVEKVSESHLTTSAEKQAKQKKDAEEKKKDQEVGQKQKRAAITAPEKTPPRITPSGVTPTSSKKKPAVQAPPSNTKPPKRPQIQAPPRSKSPDRSQKSSKHQPIVYESSEERRHQPREASERDSRRIIAAAPNKIRIQKSPIRTSSISTGRRGESLIIEARIDASNCRDGGATIKRSVERTVVSNNISTSQLRRQQQKQQQQQRKPSPPIQRRAPARSPPAGGAPRASYHTEQYNREHRGENQNPKGGARRRYEISPIRDNVIYEYQEVEQQPPRGKPSRRSAGDSSSRQQRGMYENPPEEPLRRRRHDEAKEAARMIEMLKRQEEEQQRRREEEELARFQQEKIALAKERERIRFEQEKLEAQKLQFELERQKAALEQAVARSGYRSSASSESQRRGSRDSTNPRRRPAGDVHSSSTPAKMHTEERGSRRGRESEGRHSSTTSNHSSSSRQHHTYGIQSSGSDYSKATSYETAPPRGGSNSGYSSTSSFQGYGYASSNNYPVWGGLDAQGRMDTNWTSGGSGATPSSSTSSVVGGGAGQWSAAPSQRRGDYGYRMNNY